jgi:tetratricopeptide (TPR) repeat protein
MIGSSWKALRIELARARAFYEAGDREQALKATEAALTIDPDFLAAQALKQCILGDPAPGDVSSVVKPYAGVASLRVSAKVHPALERSSKRRRADRLVDAACLALDGGRRSQALTAIAEIASLDPNNPELAVLKTRVGGLPRPDGRPSRRWFSAAGLMVCCVLGSYVIYIYHALETKASTQPPTAPAAAWPTQLALPASSAPGSGVVASMLDRPRPQEQRSLKALDERISSERRARATAGSRQTARPLGPDSKSTAGPRERRPQSATTPAVSTAQGTLLSTAIAPPAHPLSESAESVPLISARSSDVAAPASFTNVTAAIPAASAANDEHLVRGVLQRYREAYADLDAQAARAVWPRVDETALARAFDGLRSQQITFYDCNLEVVGAAASARCNGSMRYVRKIGSHDPRIEPRVWNFHLRKRGTDWTIESARVDP